MKIQLNNRTMKVEETGNENVPFKLHTEKATYRGIQNQLQNNVIAVMDKSFRKVGYFDKNTMKQLQTL